MIVDHYAELIAGLDEAPIIIGHSFGGAFTQLLLDRGLGSRRRRHRLRARSRAFPTCRSRRSKRLHRSSATRSTAAAPFRSTPRQFHYAFTNTLTEEDSDAIYERYAVPAAATVLFEARFANLHRHPPTEVDFENDERAPLLFIAFENDHIIPPKATLHNAEKYAKFEGHHRLPASSRAVPTSRPRPAGRRSPTSCSTGRSTRGRSIDPTRQSIAKVVAVDDAKLRNRIEELVAEERRLLAESVGRGPDDERHQRLEEVKVQLDQVWDLLRQREAHEEYRLDPDNTSVRDAGTVEGYEQ